jgi:protein involved in polysaccharide export with SLBB domain
MLEAKTFRVWFGVAVLMCAISRGEALRAQEKPHSIASATEYHIHAGDVVKLDVWKHPEITRTVPVDRKGNLHLPLIHDVKAAGLTAMELAGVIRQKLEGIIPNPQVTVIITEISDPSSLPPELVPQMLLHRQEPLSPDLKHKCCVA